LVGRCSFAAPKADDRVDIDGVDRGLFVVSTVKSSVSTFCGGGGGGKRSKDCFDDEPTEGLR